MNWICFSNTVCDLSTVGLGVSCLWSVFIHCRFWKFWCGNCCTIHPTVLQKSIVHRDMSMLYSVLLQKCSVCMQTAAFQHGMLINQSHLLDRKSYIFLDSILVTVGHRFPSSCRRCHPCITCCLITPVTRSMLYHHMVASYISHLWCIMWTDVYFNVRLRGQNEEEKKKEMEN